MGVELLSCTHPPKNKLFDPPLVAIIIILISVRSEITIKSRLAIFLFLSVGQKSHKCVSHRVIIGVLQIEEPQIHFVP